MPNLTNSDILISSTNAGILLSNKQGSQTLNDLFALPFNIFISKPNHEIANLNDQCLRNLDYLSRHDAVGATFEKKINNKSQILKIYENDNQVIRNKQFCVFEEIGDLNNGIHLHTLTFKFPLFNDNKQLLGLIGCAIILQDRSFSEVAADFSIISNQLLLDKPIAKTEKASSSTNIPYFSPREIDILRLLIQGKTAKETAKILNLSHRTVEYYLQNIKIKANVENKSQLIEKAIYHYNISFKKCLYKDENRIGKYFLEAYLTLINSCSFFTFR
ncbi:MAG: PAS and helix-turn-helix domain-containing protein [Tatlockia sp.]|nr:PAS and helix-turn-helix domain-containing protein [Tatlockia sp.]